MHPLGLLRAERAVAAVLSRAVRVDGTTLATTFAPTGAAGGYRLLSEVPGFPLVVRTLGTPAKAGREDRRAALATVVHLTDVHLIDAQSPGRVEFLDRYADAPTKAIPFDSAWRPQETLTGQVAEAMIQRINAIGRGPVTGRAFDCAVSTGDVVDNCQLNELGWHVGLLDGGQTITPNSGGPGYEGVQDADPLTQDGHYWHPDVMDPAGDLLKSQHGFPVVPGMLAAAVAPFPATGLKTRWFATHGNHDGLLSGNAPPNPVLDAVLTGPIKVVSLPAGVSPGDLATGLAAQDPAVLTALATAPGRPVAADARRRSIGIADWVDAHLSSPAVPGPKGHGLTEAMKASGDLYHSFDIAPGVLGVSLDTCARGGYADGSIYEGQLAWLAGVLKAASSAKGGTDRLVVLFSHHNLATLDNPVPDPTKPTEQRVPSAAIEALLHEHPNVVAWVNGHSHVNRVLPHPHPSGAGGFWEILTAAHVDWPQQSRIVEIADNKDGTLSIFGTIVDHAGPARAASVAPGRVLDLAGLSRELSFNDPQMNLAAVGQPQDRNVELLLPAPFALSPTAAAATTTTARVRAPAGSGGSMPATGISTRALLVGGGAAVAAAVAARAAAASGDDEG